MVVEEFAYVEDSAWAGAEGDELEGESRQGSAMVLSLDELVDERYLRALQTLEKRKERVTRDIQGEVVEREECLVPATIALLQRDAVVSAPLLPFVRDKLRGLQQIVGFDGRQTLVDACARVGLSL